MTKKVDWHKIVQEILEKHLPLLSGKVICDRGRERPHTIRFDFLCHAKGGFATEKTKRYNKTV